MRILIISYYYAPVVNPRAFRWTAIAEYWAAQGHAVDVITSWKPQSARCERLNDVNVFRVGGGIVEVLRERIKNSMAHRACGNQRGKFVARTVDSRKGPRSPFVAKWVYEHTWKQLYWPDFACLWFFSALREGQRKFGEKNYDELISVSHPFTGHLVAQRLRRQIQKTVWLMDIGDPFCFLDRTPTNNHKLYRKLNFIVERRSFWDADLVSVTTESTKERYADLFPESAKKIHVIPPILSLTDTGICSAPIFCNDNVIRLVFVGTLYKSIRAPDFLLKLFQFLTKNCLSKKLEMHFWGTVENCEESFLPYKMLLGDNIFIHGVAGRTEAIHAMREASILVNIGNQTDYQLPSKIIEYMSTGKPIINLIKNVNDCSKEFLEKYRKSLTIVEKEDTFESEEMEKIIRFVENEDESMDVNDINKLTESHTVKVIGEIYRCLLENNTEKN
jgi:glycosyltransferase involved in cell wall biosynthesis